MAVDVGESVVFRFSSPLSITSLSVSNRLEEEFWDLIADEFKPAPLSEGVWAESGSFQIWPIDQAPPEVLAMLAQIQEREDRRLEEEGPRKPPLFEVIYRAATVRRAPLSPYLRATTLFSSSLSRAMLTLTSPSVQIPEV